MAVIVNLAAMRKTRASRPAARPRFPQFNPRVILSASVFDKALVPKHLTLMRKPLWRPTRRSLICGAAANAIYASMAPANLAVLDGSLNAPSGTAQFPSILSNYAARPPWKVAGVDYHVGIDRSQYRTNANLKNPLTINPTSFGPDSWINTAKYQLAIKDNGVTLNGYDFSLDGGWQVVISSANVTFTNCNFVFGANQWPLPTCTRSSSNVSFINCEFNMQGLNDNVNGGNGCCILCESTVSPPTNALTVQYCFIQQAYADFIDQFGGGVGTYEYNLCYENGMGGHPDWFQTVSGNYTLIFRFNTFYNPAGYGIGTRGVMIGGDMLYRWTVVGANDFSYNSLIATGAPGTSYAISVTVTGPAYKSGDQCLLGTCKVQNNYFDQSVGQAITMYGGDYSGSPRVDHGSLGNVTCSGNINMRNGATINYVKT